MNEIKDMLREMNCFMVAELGDNLFLIEDEVNGGMEEMTTHDIETKYEEIQNEKTTEDDF